MYREEEDTTIYKVVVNHEEQYSIWPLERENPLGWIEWHLLNLLKMPMPTNFLPGDDSWLSQ